MLFFLLALWALPTFALDTRVQLDSGKIIGVEAAGVTSFKGIPYVAPPTGGLRWKSAHTVVPWAGTRNAKEFGAACPQPPILEQRYGIKFEQTSEDCLTLNVWTSAKVSNERRPVIFWIHFGGNIAGSGSVVDGSSLARQGAVVVSINYRLGPFGFLSLPSLTNESLRKSSGNYGLLDQVAALLWLHRNIDKFGGDPQNVTIVGVSAGGGDVCRLMTSPMAKGLFQRAIVESGAIFPRSEVTLAAAEKSGAKLFGDNLAGLRLRSTEEIMGAAGFDSGAAYEPVVDGWVIPDGLAKTFESGSQANVPLIVGMNADDGSIFTENPPYKTIADYRNYLTSRYSSTVFDLYPATEVAQIHDAVTRFTTDLLFLTPARRLARAHAALNPKTYIYYFTHPTGTRGAYHTSEVPFVFAADPANELAKAMSGAWLRFAATGNPNGGGLPQWPAYSSAGDQYLEFGDTIKSGAELHKKEIDALTALNR
jgi:para-nitrobenzyl esterase